MSRHAAGSLALDGIGLRAPTRRELRRGLLLHLASLAPDTLAPTLFVNCSCAPRSRRFPSLSASSSSYCYSS
eukprot:2917501-Rhodomonas_salina.1